MKEPSKLSLFAYITYYTVGVATVSTFNDTIVREGDTTTITCEAFGYPPPTVVWSRINGILSDRVSVSDSVSVLTENGNVTKVSINLTITNAFREDTGVYTCSANNSIGSDNRNVSITVQCKFLLLGAVFLIQCCQCMCICVLLYIFALRGFT